MTVGEQVFISSVLFLIITMNESQPARDPPGLLLSELATLVDNKAFPLFEEALVHVGKEVGHEGIILLLFVRLTLTLTQCRQVVALELSYSREVLLHDYRGN